VAASAQRRNARTPSDRPRSCGRFCVGTAPTAMKASPGKIRQALAHAVIEPRALCLRVILGRVGKLWQMKLEESKWSNIALRLTELLDRFATCPAQWDSGGAGYIGHLFAQQFCLFSPVTKSGRGHSASAVSCRTGFAKPCSALTEIGCRGTVQRRGGLGPVSVTTTSPPLSHRAPAVMNRSSRRGVKSAAIGISRRSSCRCVAVEFDSTSPMTRLAPTGPPGAGGGPGLHPVPDGV